MVLTDIERQTAEFYNRTGKQWADLHSTQENFWGIILERFQQLLPFGKVLEIGSGGGRDARILIGLNYDYTGTDVSTGLLEVARANNPGANFLEQSVYELDFTDDTFDGFWATAVLLHIPRERIQEALASIVRVCKDGAVGFISIKEGEGDDIEANDDGSRLFTYYLREAFISELTQAGMEVVGFDYQPVSQRTRWLKFLVKVRKPAES